MPDCRPLDPNELAKLCKLCAEESIHTPCFVCQEAEKTEKENQ
jgi:hypothetical protein